jgi:WhiB family redox-sensing transcriptional regulator
MSVPVATPQLSRAVFDSRGVDVPAERHPDAVEADWEWQLHGSCRGADSELFFHPYGEREPSRSRREQAALAICRGCPVMARCRQYALDAREPYGVWGAMTETERADALSGRRVPLGPRRRYDVA